jgi:hypothetical protein
VVLWFVGGSVLLVWLVFRSPALDYRLVALGSLIPLIDLATGGVHVLHTLAAAVAALLVVMAATRHRRLRRRRWLGIPIGMFLHLVLDGTWQRAKLFWWPAFGTTFPGAHVPEMTRPAGVLAAMELAGAAALVWLWRRFRLMEAPRRSELLRTGRFSRDLAQGPEAGF